MGLLVIIFLGLCCYGCFRWGAYHSNRENATLRSQLMLQEKFSREWANEARGKYNLYKEVSTHHVSSAAENIQTVIKILQALKQEQGNNLSQQEQQKINEIIDSTKRILRE